MRYLAIAIVLLSYPGLVYLLQANPRSRYWAYFGLGLLPFTVAVWNFDAGLINWATWPGYVKGAVMTLVDSLALAIITTHRHPRGLPPLIGFVALYILAAALSIAQSEVPMASAFYVFQLMRFTAVIIAVSKIAHDPRALKWLGMGLATAMIYEAWVTGDQKLRGVFQAPGTLGHPNQLGMMAHFVVLPLIGMLLAGYRSWLMLLGIAGALVAIVFGASRGTILFVGLGVAVVLLLSLRRQVTPHKKRMFAFAATMMLVATPFLLNSVGKRMAQQQEHASDYDEREAFERSAKMMWNDHPMGVGANTYVVVANGQGYSARAGVAWAGGSRATNVHNTYLLVAAETGWAGLFTYVLLLGACIVAGWRFAFGNRSDPRGDIVLGSTVAIIMMAIHSKYEWITLSYEVQYVFAISVGIISGLIRVRALERRQAQRARAEERHAAHATSGEAVV